VSFTLVSFHAHPDDEVLFTGGTLAKAAQDGHRVVLAVATNGAAGLASPQHHRGSLAGQRMAELEKAAAILGCAEVVPLGFTDSGWRTQPAANSFSRLPLEEAAGPLIELLEKERADALTIYDPVGGYGHPDHRQVHAAGTYAAGVAGTPVVLEATIERELIGPVIRLMALAPGLLPDVRGIDPRTVYTARADITHRVDVGGFVEQKRRALQAHVSQTTAGSRTLTMLLKLPARILRRVLGTEWYVEQGRSTNGQPQHDIFATLTEGIGD
jgi:LmbE family N-acetylglucosaminyl deacetylase